MKKSGKVILRILLVLVVACAALWVFGPYEPDDLSADFEPAKFGEGVQVYFESVEARFDDITPGVEKQVIWAGASETRTPWSVLYVHGFSATAQEIRPVPDQVADALGANLVFTRLQGHGRSGEAMAEGSVAGWMADLAEGLAAARAVGDRVLVISTSTGGTLVAAGAVDGNLMKDVAGVVLVSPNFAINSPIASLLTWPAARYWLPLIVGKTRSFEPVSPDQAKYWSTTYPTVAVLPMAAVVRAVDRLDLSRADVPALFIFSEDDQVVRPEITRQMADEWGGATEIVNPVMGPEDDNFAHVIAGDIRSPGQTAPTVAAILKWAGEL